MSSSPFWRRLFGKGARRGPARKRAAGARRARLALERLAARELRSGDTPSILGTAPADHSTSPNGSPTLQVFFSEDVSGAGTASNYLLFNSKGQAFAITGASYTNQGSGGLSPFQA